MTHLLKSLLITAGILLTSNAQGENFKTDSPEQKVTISYN